MNFEQQDFSKLAAAIREKPNEASAIMSNHYNVVLAALDLAAAVWYQGREPVKDLPPGRARKVSFDVMVTRIVDRRRDRAKLIANKSAGEFSLYDLFHEERQLSMARQDVAAALQISLDPASLLPDGDATVREAIVQDNYFQSSPDPILQNGLRPSPGDEVMRQAIIDLGDKVRVVAKTEDGVKALAALVVDMAVFVRGMLEYDHPRFHAAKNIEAAAIKIRNDLA